MTVRLSKLFHERFGDEIADEVVNWFNSLDSNSRSDLKEINELNFARFDAKLEQRVAEVLARLDKRFAEQDVRIEKRFAELEIRMEQRFAAQDVKLSDLQTSIERSMKEQSRWMILSWATMMAGVIGLWMRPWF